MFFEMGAGSAAGSICDVWFWKNAPKTLHSMLYTLYYILSTIYYIPYTTLLPVYYTVYYVHLYTMYYVLITYSYKSTYMYYVLYYILSDYIYIYNYKLCTGHYIWYFEIIYTIHYLLYITIRACHLKPELIHMTLWRCWVRLKLKPRDINIYQNDLNLLESSTAISYTQGPRIQGVLLHTIFWRLASASNGRKLIGLAQPRVQRYSWSV